MATHKKSEGSKPRDATDNTADNGNSPRHRVIYEQLLHEIQSGVYGPGERLPSEATLCERFQVSRITVAKAFQSLQRDHLVTRRPGSGTFVEKPAQHQSLHFGLLISDLGTSDVFERICQGILRSPAAKSHSLTWGNSTGHTTDLARVAEQLCDQYIAQKVAGVFFAPVEYANTHEHVNRGIAARLDKAGIPMVLLDRCFEPYPDRSHFDLVGIDNHQAGYVLTRHLIRMGAKRILFAARRNSANTVNARIAGFRETNFSLLGKCDCPVVNGDFEDEKLVSKILDHESPDGIVCGNDMTAARLMRTLGAIGVKIPEDIKMAGVDDVNYARYLPTPLTTIRQDCAEIGAAAMSVMLDRIQRPNQPVKTVFIKAELIVRESSGYKSEE
jgi:DNA-binding LacI/PurR family transcriptional regulator